jgi:hypothetical protein
MGAPLPLSRTAGAARRLSLVESMEKTMRQPQQAWRASTFAATMVAASAAQAQDDSTVGKAVAAKQASEIRRGDPARWYREDPTRQARLRTLKKEIGAAYEEAKNACREGGTGGRGACLKEARARWEQYMKNAPAQLDAAPEQASR